jgi:hypothetical protein
MTAERPDDSPALGGRSDDNAPMISSVETRVIVSARGAYIVGNLPALIPHLTPDQQVALHRAIVAQALYFAEPGITSAEMEVSALIRRWMDGSVGISDEALVDHVFQTGILQTGPNSDLVTPGSLHSRIYYARAQTNAVHLLREVLLILTWDNLPQYNPLLHILMRTFNYRHFSGDVKQALDLTLAEAKRWQVEAAWAILQHRDPPPLDNLEPGDAEANYRAARLDLLIARMSEEQQIRFRQALLRQFLLGVTPIPDQAGESLRAMWQTYLECTYHWLDTPTINSILHMKTTARQIQWEAGQSRRHPAPTVIEHNLVDAVWQIYNCAVHDLHEAAMKNLAYRHSFWSWDAPPAAEDETIPVNQHRRDWQLDTAWAILHDQPIPPQEPT